MGYKVVLRHFSKVIFIILFVFMIPSISNAQIKFGFNGGINFASYTLSNKAPEATLKNKTGFSIGAVADYSFIKSLSLRLVVKYNQRGGENEIAILGGIQNKVYFDYIEISPLIMYKVIDDRISAKVMGGISYGYLVSAKIKSESDEFDIKDDYNNSNISADFGIEVEVPILARISFIVNGIYSLGLTDISKMDGTVKTKDIQISAGLLYNIL